MSQIQDSDLIERIKRHVAQQHQLVLSDDDPCLWFVSVIAVFLKESEKNHLTEMRQTMDGLEEKMLQIAATLEDRCEENLEDNRQEADLVFKRNLEELRKIYQRAMEGSVREVTIAAEESTAELIDKLRIHHLDLDLLVNSLNKRLWQLTLSGLVFSFLLAVCAFFLGSQFHGFF